MLTKTKYRIIAKHNNKLAECCALDFQLAQSTDNEHFSAFMEYNLLTSLDEKT